MAFKSKITPNIGGSIFTPSTITPVIPGSQTLTVIGLSIANTANISITASARLVKNGISAFIIKDALIESGNTLVVVGGDQKLVLEEGDSITAYANGTNQADAIISYLI